MNRIFLLAKLHQARVTHADLEYEGSFSIDEEILMTAGILENEQVQVYNIDNGERFTTYAIRAPKGSRMMGANGACAHLVRPGDRVIICVYASLEEHEWINHKPKILFLDHQNHFTVKTDEHDMIPAI